jgi:two-component system, LytTR family, response regulator
MYDEILYLEATGNYVTFVLAGKKVLARTTFAEAIHRLPQQKFVRVHRSYMVSVCKIEKVERHQVTIGTHKIPVSEAYQQPLQMMLR